MGSEHEANTLVTVWSHLEFDQKLVIPGNREETRPMAEEYIDGDPKSLTGDEQMWSDKRLRELPEFEGFEG